MSEPRVLRDHGRIELDDTAPDGFIRHVRRMIEESDNLATREAEDGDAVILSSVDRGDGGAFEEVDHGE